MPSPTPQACDRALCFESVRRRSRSLSLWLLGLGAACAAAPEKPADTGPKLGPTVGVVERFLPLPDDSVMAYDTVDEETSERGLVVLRIERPRPGRVELRDGGRVQRLAVMPDGVSHITGGYLLKAPIARGASFPGRFGQVTISRTDLKVSVPAGQFSGCVETIEEDSNGSKRATTVYCPDVGMVSLMAEGASEGELLSIRFELRSYGPALNIAELPPEEEPEGE